MRKFLQKTWSVIQMAHGQDLAAAIRARSQKLDIQLEQMRSKRIAAEKELETTALQGVRESVDELQKLLRGMNAAEGAAIKFVEDVNVQARTRLEEELSAKYESILSSVAHGESIPNAVQKMLNKNSVGIAKGANPEMEIELGTLIHHKPNLGTTPSQSSSNCIECVNPSALNLEHDVPCMGAGNRQRMKDGGES